MQRRPDHACRHVGVGPTGRMPVYQPRDTKKSSRAKPQRDSSSSATSSGYNVGAPVSQVRTTASAKEGKMRSVSPASVVVVFGLVFGTAGRSEAAITNPFDRDIGANTYQNGFSDVGNWPTTTDGLRPRAGNDFFATALASPGEYHDIGMTKDLGGLIENTPYEVSFFIAKYYGESFTGAQFADFNKLRIGGPDGSMEWLETPAPTVRNQWVQWVGRYTPAPGDVGQPFLFEFALAELRLGMSMAID